MGAWPRLTGSSSSQLLGLQSSAGADAPAGLGQVGTREDSEVPHLAWQGWQTPGARAAHSRRRSHGGSGFCRAAGGRGTQAPAGWRPRSEEA